MLQLIAGIITLILGIIILLVGGSIINTITLSNANLFLTEGQSLDACFNDLKNPNYNKVILTIDAKTTPQFLLFNPIHDSIFFDNSNVTEISNQNKILDNITTLGQPRQMVYNPIQNKI